MFGSSLVPQMTSRCRSQSSAHPPSATPPGASTLWRERRGTSTLAPSARATAGGYCVRRRCARRCSARTPPAPRTPAARSAQVTGAAPQGCSPSLLIPQNQWAGWSPCSNVPGPVTSIPGRSDPGSRLPKFIPSVDHIFMPSVCLAPEMTLNNNRKLFLPFFSLNRKSQTQERVLLHQIIPNDFAIVKSHLCHCKCEEQLLIKNVT